MTQSISSPLPPDEEERLESLLNYHILDTPEEEQLDELTSLAASIFSVPIVLITIIDRNRQWFKSNYGLAIKETQRSISFCQYTIMGNGVYEVEDALTDNCFRSNPLVTGSPYIRYYCGAPLLNEKGFRMGSLALIDQAPRKLDEAQKKTLILLAQQVVNFFELNQTRKALENEKQHLEDKVALRTKELEQKVLELNQKDQKLVSVHNELNRLIYRASHDLLGPLKTLEGITHLALDEVNEENIRYYLQLSRATQRKLDHALVNLLKIVTIKDAADFTAIDWNSVLMNALTRAKSRVSEKSVQLYPAVSVRRAFLSDPSLLEMMIEELLVNSMQFNLRERVLITVQIHEKNDHIEIVLNDNGMGIRQEEQDKIFEMFYKIPPSKGSGLGLYIVKNVVEKLQGHIRMASSNNTGTTFYLLIPFRSADPV